VSLGYWQAIALVPAASELISFRPGEDGLGGVAGLPKADSPAVLARFATGGDGTIIKALEGIAMTVKKTWKNGTGHRVSVVSCGPMTNIALFVTVYPELLDGVEEFVFMGGAIGLGNRSAVAGLYFP
jgi:uridine nucleosidase